MIDLFNKIESTIEKEYPKSVEVYDTDQGDSYVKVTFLIDGDWKHDHLAFKYWMDQNASDLFDCEVKYNGSEEDEDSDSDNYKATYTYSFIPNDVMTDEMPIEEMPPQGEEEMDMDMMEEEPMEPPVEGEEPMEPMEDEMMGESLKFNIAKEQLKRFNEGKMPENWSPRIYLENLAKRNHISREEKSTLEEAFLLNK